MGYRPGETGDVSSGVAADVRAGDGEDLRPVHGSHHLATARLDACFEKEPVKLMPSSRSGSHSLTLITVGGKPLTSSSRRRRARPVGCAR